MSDSKSRDAFNDLLDVLREASERCVGPEWGVTDPADIGDGLRNLTHILQSALFAHQEFDPDRPVFLRIVSLLLRLVWRQSTMRAQQRFSRIPYQKLT